MTALAPEYFSTILAGGGFTISKNLKSKNPVSRISQSGFININTMHMEAISSITIFFESFSPNNFSALLETANPI